VCAVTKPTVTVLIDTFNHERFIEEAVVSVLEQDFSAAETEILVVDDGSTDRTPDILRKFGPRLRVLRKENGGQASAFNLGIPQATGEFLAFLDGDDWWAKNKLTRAVETFQAEPELGFVGHGDIFVFPDGSTQLHALHESVRFCAGNLEGALLFRLRKSFMGTCRMTVRTEILRRVLPIPEALRIQADEYMFTLAAALCEVRILPEPLFFYRFHDSNAFQMTVSSDVNRLRRKQAVLAELARTLVLRLQAFGVDPAAIGAIAESVQLEANQLRLQVDGGWSWETVETEWKTYRISYPNAPRYHQMFKALTMAAALLVPPKCFSWIRQRLTRNDYYLRLRGRFLPIPHQTHIRRAWLQKPRP